MVKRVHLALWALFIAAFSLITIPSCTDILGIETTYAKNSCNEDGGALEPISCGMGACHQLLSACDDKGLPTTDCPPEAPGPVEVCKDGLDNNCDGNIDEGCTCDATMNPSQPCYSGSTANRNVGACQMGEQLCMGGVFALCEGDVLPAREVCDDGIDNDCDGKVDEGCPCTEGQEQPCYGGAPDTKNHTPCREGKQLCHDSAWGECVGDILPTQEVCDNVDNDCNGFKDDAAACDCADGLDKECYDGPDSTKGNTPCHAGKRKCVNGTLGPCQNQVLPNVEVCDGVDNDCDGTADNGNLSTNADCTVPGAQGECAPGTMKCTGGQQTCLPKNTPQPDNTCDGKDQNCDGTPDNGAIPNVGPQFPCTVTGALGECAKGNFACQNGMIICAATTTKTMETCDGLDNDCNGMVDEGNPGAGKACPTGKLGACSAGITACVGGAITCNQSFQPSPEACDGVDNDCDGVADNGNPGGGSNCLSGLPGVCSAGTNQCVNGALKCNQTNPATPESCDGVDNDCNGQVDEGNPQGGGPCTVAGASGLCAAGAQTCTGGKLLCAQTILPASEQCDGKDNDCDGTIDNGNPGAGSNCTTGVPGVCSKGVTSCVNGGISCNQMLQPTLETCDGLDNNCNGAVDEGNPGGGAPCTVIGAKGECAAGAIACQNGALVCTQIVSPTLETCNGKDDDCNGTTDEGNPGGGGPCSILGLQGPCAIGAFTCQSGALACAQVTSPSTEVCNGKDDNCNGQVDEGNPGGGLTCNTNLKGVCAVGTTSCAGGVTVCNQNVQAGLEQCDGKDNDCDGVIDNGNPGGGVACTIAGKFGVCAAGTTACGGGGAIVCNQNVQASNEICNGLDDNCNGQADEGNPQGGGLCTTGQQGVCSPGVFQCLNGALNCAQNVQASAEICDGLDNNCNGIPDEGNPGGGANCATGKLGICAAGTTVCTGASITCKQTVSSIAEVCDGLDNDCDGLTDNGNPGAGQVCNTGKMGICAPGTTTCTSGALVCNQNAQPTTEACDGLDNNCNGSIDEGSPGSGVACMTGQPGICAPGTTQCSGGTLSCKPNASSTAEICDGLDNNCDGVIDNGNPGSGVACNTGKSGVCAAGTTTCVGGVITCAQNVPSSVEICDGKDNDCDGAIDNGNPNGGVACATGKPGICAAGTTACSAGAVVCNQNAQPATELCNGLDDNCDSVIDNGNPGGGAACTTGQMGACSAGTTTCSGGNIACVPNAPATVETCDGLDNNCDGIVDNGNPGGGVACTTGKPGVCSPGVTACTAGALACNQNTQPSAEICNGFDDDCNGVIDENIPVGAACSTGKQGVCAAGTLTCTGGAFACNQNVQPSAEICEGTLDENCNGSVDEGCNCINGTTQPCYSGMATTSGVGACHPGVKTCVGGSFGACIGEVTPIAETCDGIDNDCNGTVDNGVPGLGVMCNTGKPGVCGPGVTACTAGAMSCSQNVQPSAEICNGKDDNCNNTIDEGTSGIACSTGLLGACAAGTSLCTAGVPSCTQSVLPTTELCGDAIDQDCDGKNGAYLPLVGGGMANWDMSSSMGWVNSPAGVWDFPALAVGGCNDPTVDTSPSSDNMIAGVHVGTGGCVGSLASSDLMTPAIITTPGTTVYLQYQRLLNDNANVMSTLYATSAPAVPPTSYLFCSGSKPSTGCPGASPATTADMAWVSLKLAQAIAINPTSSSTQIVWHYQATGTQNVGGWNIDDVAVVDDPCQ